MIDRNLLLQEGDILESKTCEVNGIEYSLVKGGECIGCAGNEYDELCIGLADCSSGMPQLTMIWIKKDSK